MKIPLFYKQKPTFGLDIGHSTVRVAELTKSRRQARVNAYGYAAFDSAALDTNGAIVKPELIIKALKPLFTKQLIGDLTTDRVALAVPVSETYSRILTLPDMDKHDLEQAVHLEAEQYIPVPLENLYLEYEVINRFRDQKKDQPMLEITMVAAPKKIIDSYLELVERLKLETERIEPSLFAIMRSIKHVARDDKAKVVIDFGSRSSDLAVYDNNVRVISTIATGGEQITEALMGKLGITQRQATGLKVHHGIAKSPYQQKISQALAPTLTDLSEEVQKIIRYYHDRQDVAHEIDQIMLVGGGANMPGLASFLKQLTGLNVVICNPWENITLGRMQPPHKLELTLYSTAIGLALEGIDR